MLRHTCAPQLHNSQHASLLPACRQLTGQRYCVSHLAPGKVQLAVGNGWLRQHVDSQAHDARQVFLQALEACTGAQITQAGAVHC